MNFRQLINLLKLYENDRDNRQQIKELLINELNKLNDDTVQDIKMLRNEIGLTATYISKYSYDNTYDIKIKYSGANNKIYLYLDDNKYKLEFSL